MTDEIREIISKYDSLEEARSKSRGQEKVLINMYADNKENWTEVELKKRNGENMRLVMYSWDGC